VKSHNLSRGFLTVKRDIGGRTAAAAGKFPLVGNHRCIDFVNTEIVERGRRIELLRDFGDLVSWLAQAQVLDAGLATALLRRWGRTSTAADALSGALAFRRVLRDMIDGLSRGARPSDAALARINTILRRHAVEVGVVRGRSGFERRQMFRPTEPLDLLVPVAESASDLLCHGDPGLVLKCENPRCILYFYDTTRNHARRWCSMTVCGNRMKVAAHYRRRRRTKRRSPGGTRAG
jgi:predicted RNA-binding Zn ribbon-like protein